jgi:hypothetical protein
LSLVLVLLPHLLPPPFSNNVCIATALLEFQIPPQISRYASFLFSFLGRGVFYIFVGSILLDHWTINKVFGTVVGVVGIAYCVLEFVPSIEPPANMRYVSLLGAHVRFVHRGCKEANYV